MGSVLQVAPLVLNALCFWILKLKSGDTHSNFDDFDFNFNVLRPYG